MAAFWCMFENFFFQRLIASGMQSLHVGGFLIKRRQRHIVELFRKELHAVLNIANDFISTFTQPQQVGCLRSFGDDTPSKLNDEAQNCAYRKAVPFQTIGHFSAKIIQLVI